MSALPVTNDGHKSRVKVVVDEKLTTVIQVARSRMRGAITPLPQQDLLA